MAERSGSGCAWEDAGGLLMNWARGGGGWGEWWVPLGSGRAVGVCRECGEQVGWESYGSCEAPSS